MTRQETLKQDIKKLQQNRQFLTIMVLLFVSLLFWITISLITSQKTEKISPELQTLSKALTPVIDTTAFTQIQAKRSYTESELSSFTIFKVLLSRDGQTEKVVPIEVSIDDLEPSATPAPRTSGSLLQQEVGGTQGNEAGGGAPGAAGSPATTPPSESQLEEVPSFETGFGGQL